MFKKNTEAATTKAATTAKAAKAAAPAKATKTATKAAPATKAKAKPEGTLTPNQRKLLGVIAASKTPVSYKAMRVATGMKKGLSKAVGTPSKAESGKATLLGMGLVEVVNKSVPFTFAATTKGKAALK